ncbi:RNA polymerase sigma factor [Kiritimatiellaeota bacterium B1221]|nr:RNA polymerase sigma factor [Kiritimatiellaeota bacterium B1221]
MPETDEELMRRVAKSHDGQAFRELMNRHQKLLVNHFIRRGVYQEYEDLAQETFFKIYKARKRYRTNASFRSWMFTIAQRVWIDHLRKSGRRKTREDAFKQEPQPAFLSTQPMQGHDLYWALDQLPETHRDVVVHAVFDQLSHGETAQILGIPEGTVKSRLHNGLKQLREIFNTENPA